MNRRNFFGCMFGAAVAAKIAPTALDVEASAIPQQTTSTTTNGGADVWIRWSNYDGSLEYSYDRNTWSRTPMTSLK